MRIAVFCAVFAFAAACRTLDHTGELDDTGEGDDTADTGETGDSDETGDTGDSDETGDTGDSDETGDTGDSDETGDTGDTGDTAEVTPDPPQTWLVQTPEALTRSETATFGFWSDDPDATFACALDDAEAEACTSPATFLGLAEGEHTFAVTASNEGGADPTPPSFAWTISPAAPPVAQITGGPDVQWGSTTATLWFVSDVPATFACTMDDDAAEACTSPRTYVGLAGGEHTFTVSASADSVTQPVPASYAFTVDVTPPVTSVDEAPADPVNETTATVSFHADEDGTFTCQLDGGVPLPCASPATWDDLVAGSHGVRIWGTDALGNVEIPGVTTTWTIDLGAPDTVLAGTPPNPSNNPAPSVTFTSTEDGTFLCTLDAGTAAPCTSPHAFAALAEGSHTFSVASVDLAGNADPSPPSYTWTVDVTPPSAPATASATPGNRSVNVSWAAVSGAASYGLYVDNGTTETLVSGLGGTSNNLTGLTNCGTYTVAVVAVDAAGNESTRKTTSPASPKPAAPATFTLTPQAAGTVALSWASVTNASGYRVRYGATSGGGYTGTGASIGASPASVSSTSTTPSGLTPSPATYLVVTAMDGTCEGTASVERAYDCTNTLTLCTGDATVDGVTATYRQIYSVAQLQRVNAYPTSNFMLMQNVSMSSGSLSQLASTLSTHFYGNSKTLSSYSTGNGLFGTISTTGKVSDLVIRSATISGSTNSGLVANVNEGLVVRCDVAGTSTGGGSNGSQGMLVGTNYGVVRDSVAGGTLSSTVYSTSSGGLVGLNHDGGLIDGSTSNVNVSGSGQLYLLGGLVGFNTSGGWITRSSAHGSVTENGGSSTSPQVGGLIGSNSGFVDLCWATGNVIGNTTYVSANGRVGGLVGQHAYGVVSRSYATGNVSSNSTAAVRMGGLVGQIESTYAMDGHGNHIMKGVVIDSYALGNVSGSGQVAGGLVGSNSGGVVRRSYSAGDVSTTTSGGFIGWYGPYTGSDLADSFCVGAASGSSSDPFAVTGIVDSNAWFLGADDDTSSSEALVVTDWGVFVDAATYGPDASGTPAFTWDVDHIWYVDGENLPTLRWTDIALAASPSTAAASGGTITATLTVTDEQGLPAEGVAVRLWSPSTTVVFTPEIGTTDADGVFTSAVTAASAQSVTVQALVFEDIWAVPTRITFN